MLPPNNALVVVLDEQGIRWESAPPPKPAPEPEPAAMPFWTYFIPNPLHSRL
jgi:hypothetical protein